MSQEYIVEKCVRNTHCLDHNFMRMVVAVTHVTCPSFFSHKIWLILAERTPPACWRKQMHMCVNRQMSANIQAYSSPLLGNFFLFLQQRPISTLHLLQTYTFQQVPIWPFAWTMGISCYHYVSRVFSLFSHITHFAHMRQHFARSGQFFTRACFQGWEWQRCN
jgi:hypothetical protein